MHFALCILCTVESDVEHTDHKSRFPTPPVKKNRKLEVKSSPSLLVLIQEDLCFACVTFFVIFLSFLFAFRSHNQQMDSFWVCYKQLGYGVIVISRDCILCLVPIFRGDGEHTSTHPFNFLTVTQPSVSQPRNKYCLESVYDANDQSCSDFVMTVYNVDKNLTPVLYDSNA